MAMQQAGRAASRRRSAPITFSGPLTITSGGTYTGNYRSTDSSVPAITVQYPLTAAVTITGCNIEHAGYGIRLLDNSNVTVTNNTITGITPATNTTEQQAINGYKLGSLIVENNNFRSGHGIQIDGADITHQMTTLRIRYNDYVNIGEFSTPSNYQGAVHLNNVNCPGAQVSWNKVTNHYGFSVGEDMLACSSGTKGASGNPIVFSYNMIDGVYPKTGNGSGFTGGAIDLADIAGSYLSCHHCYVVNYTNNGFMCPTEGPGITYDNCMAVYDGIADDGTTTVSSTFGCGFAVNNLYNANGSQCVLTNNRSGHRRWNGTAWETQNYVWYNSATQDGGGNTTIAATAANEQVARDEWAALVVSNGVTIGRTG